MHISSLPSPYGIGTFGEEAYKFVDFLEQSGQKYWQILPIGPTGFGDSPYQSFSTFAGNPYFIDINHLIEEGLVSNDEAVLYDCEQNPNKVNFGLLYVKRFKLLKTAFKKRTSIYNVKLNNFKQMNKDWVIDYALFMALKEYFKGKPWFLWDDDIKHRNTESLKNYKEILGNEIEFWIFTQYIFFKQWNKLKEYANSKGIEIIGDIPIYVAHDSSDVWVNPEMFELDERLNPKIVAGCPPDAFSATGQLWGNPIYKWGEMEKDDYSWWLKRISSCSKMYDIIRIDHFRGFDSFYAIPASDKTAENGEWRNGPGIKFFNILKSKLGDIKIIAEDLGFLTESVRKLRSDTGYPGMKILQFAFDSREESDYLPHNYEKNCIVYTGTHDNDTCVGWFKSISPEDKAFCKKYLGLRNDNKIAYTMIKTAWASVADTAIAPFQDFLNLDSSARMNMPSTLGGNWEWRVSENVFNNRLSNEIKTITKIYGRLK